MMTKRKTVIFVLLAMVLLGVLVHSLGLWTLNRILPVEKIAEMNAVGTRLFWRELVETAVGFFFTISLLGGVIMLYQWIKKGFPVSFFKMFLFFLGMVVAMFLCALPFAVTDPKFYFDYFFPVWQLLPYIGILFLILCGYALKRRLTVNRVRQ